MAGGSRVEDRGWGDGCDMQEWRSRRAGAAGGHGRREVCGLGAGPRVLQLADRIYRLGSGGEESGDGRARRWSLGRLSRLGDSGLGLEEDEGADAIVELPLLEVVANAVGLMPQLGGGAAPVVVPLAITTAVAGLPDSKRCARVMSWAWGGDATDRSRGWRQTMLEQMNDVIRVVIEGAAALVPLLEGGATWSPTRAAATQVDVVACQQLLVPAAPFSQFNIMWLLRTLPEGRHPCPRPQRAGGADRPRQGGGVRSSLARRRRGSWGRHPGRAHRRRRARRRPA